MNRTIKIAYKITKNICAEENTYIYDVEIKKEEWIYHIQEGNIQNKY